MNANSCSLNSPANHVGRVANPSEQGCQQRAGIPAHDSDRTAAAVGQCLAQELAADGEVFLLACRVRFAFGKKAEHVGHSRQACVSRLIAAVQLAHVLQHKLDEPFNGVLDLARCGRGNLKLAFGLTGSNAA